MPTAVRHRARVLLVLAPSESSFSPLRRNLPPLALATLQTYLRASGHEVVSVDLNLALPTRPDGPAWASLVDKTFVLDVLRRGTGLDRVHALFGSALDRPNPRAFDVVGLSCGADFSLFQIHAALAIGALLDAISGRPVVLGGTNITYLYQFRETYAELWTAIRARFPYVIKGAGERPFARIIAALADRSAPALRASLPGAIVDDGATIRANDEDLPTLVRPDFAGLALERYTTCVRVDDERQNEIDFFKLPYWLNLQASEANRRGRSASGTVERVFLPYVFNHHCPYRCAFCEQSDERKCPPCSKDAPSVVDDVTHLAATHRTRYFYFFNNCFNYRSAFVREFCQRVVDRRLDLRWSDCARATGLARPLVEQMYAAGCRKLIFGLETASPRLLRYIDKRMTLDQLEQALTWCAAAGIWADVEVIVGFPFEFEDDFQATCRFLERNAHRINQVYVNRYFVVPSSLIGTYPDRYRIRLTRVRSYDDLAARAARVFARGNVTTGSDALDTPFHIFAFDEIGGRTHAQIVGETADKLARLSALVDGLRGGAGSPLMQPAKA